MSKERGALSMYGLTSLDIILCLGSCDATPEKLEEYTAYLALMFAAHPLGEPAGSRLGFDHFNYEHYRSLALSLDASIAMKTWTNGPAGADAIAAFKLFMACDTMVPNEILMEKWLSIFNPTSTLADVADRISKAREVEARRNYF